MLILPGFQTIDLSCSDTLQIKTHKGLGLQLAIGAPLSTKIRPVFGVESELISSGRMKNNAFSCVAISIPRSRTSLDPTVPSRLITLMRVPTAGIWRRTLKWFSAVQQFGPRAHRGKKLLPLGADLGGCLAQNAQSGPTLLKFCPGGRRGGTNLSKPSPSLSAHRPMGVPCPGATTQGPGAGRLRASGSGVQFSPPTERDCKTGPKGLFFSKASRENSILPKTPWTH